MDWSNDRAVRLARQFLEDKMEVVCELLETDMKEKTSSKPVVDTGNYLNSFDHKVISEPEKVVGIIFNTAEYAPWIEFGTGEFAEGGKGRKGGWVYFHPKLGEFRFTMGMKPRPIMRSALLENKNKIKEFLDAR